MPDFKTILMPTDFSPASDLALEYAAFLARHTGGVIHLIHVVAFPIDITSWPASYWVELGAVRDRLRRDAERELAARATSIDGIEVTTELIEGSPARTIVDAAAARGCHLIVMGTHGRGGFSRFFLGSVAERVLRTARCPVLTVSPAIRLEQAPSAAADRYIVRDGSTAHRDP